MKEFRKFDFQGNEVNDWVEVPDDLPFHTQHLTREIIGQFFEREKVLRTLSSKDREKYKWEYTDELRTYIPLENSHSAFEEHGKWGWKNDVLGSVLISPVYDEVTDLPYFHHPICKVRSGNKYGLVRPSKEGGEVIFPPVYDGVMTLEDYLGHYCPLLALVLEQNGKYGLYMEDGKPTKPVYDKLTGYDEYVLTEKDGKYGYWDGVVHILAEYDEIQVPSLMGWIRARKENVWGYFDVDYQFTEDVSEAFLMKYLGEWYVDEDEREYLSRLFQEYSSLVDSVYHSTMPEKQRKYVESKNDPNEIFGKRMLYTQYDAQTHSRKMGLQFYVTGMDLIPPRYDDLEQMTDDVFRYALNGKYGLVLADGKGTELCPPLYDEIERVNRIIDHVLVRMGEKWGIINISNSDYPTELEYDELLDRQRDWGVELLIKKGNKLGVFINGVTVSPVYDGIFVPEIFGWVRVCRNGEWGYIDINDEFTMDMNEAYLYYSES